MKRYHQNFILSLEESIDRIEDEFNVKICTKTSDNKLKLNYFIFKQDGELKVVDKDSKYSTSLESLGYLPSQLNLVFYKN